MQVPTPAIFQLKRTLADGSFVLVSAENKKKIKIKF